MAAVEKRKPAFLALLLNHLMFMFICTFVILPLSGWAKTVFGIVMCLLYLFGVHDYCHKAGLEHSRPYIKTEPSAKFPLYYGVVGNIFFWFPVLLALILGQFNLGDGVKFGSRLFYLIWDSPWIFLDIFTSTDYNALNPTWTVTASLLYFTATFSGYYMGANGKHIAGFLSIKRKTNKNKESK